MLGGSSGFIWETVSLPLRYVVAKPRRVHLDTWEAALRDWLVQRRTDVLVAAMVARNGSLHWTNSCWVVASLQREHRAS